MRGLKRARAGWRGDRARHLAAAEPADIQLEARVVTAVPVRCQLKQQCDHGPRRAREASGLGIFAHLIDEPREHGVRVHDAKVQSGCCFFGSGDIREFLRAGLSPELFHSTSGRRGSRGTFQGLGWLTPSMRMGTSGSVGAHALLNREHEFEA